MKYFRNLRGGKEEQQNSNPPQVALEDVNIQPPVLQSDTPTQPKEKGVFEFSSDYPRLQLALRTYCTAAVLLMIGTSFYAFGATTPCAPEYFFLIDTWLILLGAVAISVEWRQKHARKFFHFLAFRTGRGFFYLFLGSLTTGIDKYLGLFVGICVIVGGLLTLTMSFFLNRKKKYHHVTEEDLSQANPQNNSANLSPIQPPPREITRPKSTAVTYEL